MREGKEEGKREASEPNGSPARGGAARTKEPGWVGELGDPPQGTREGGQARLSSPNPINKSRGRVPGRRHP